MKDPRWRVKFGTSPNRTHLGGSISWTGEGWAPRNTDCPLCVSAQHSAVCEEKWSGISFWKVMSGESCAAQQQQQQLSHLRWSQKGTAPFLESILEPSCPHPARLGLIVTIMNECLWIIPKSVNENCLQYGSAIESQNNNIWFVICLWNWKTCHCNLILFVMTNQAMNALQHYVLIFSLVIHFTLV